MSVRILYILSSGHSGSTLTDLILGSHSNIESAGEVEKYWKLSSGIFLSGDETRKMCACMKSVDKCKYWKRVNEEVSKRHSTSVDVSHSENEFEIMNYSLVESILKVSGKSVFCDSSKSISRLERLLESELFNVEIIHLVRDPRATGYSIKRKGIRKDDTERYNFSGEIKDWKARNNLFLRKFSNLQNYYSVRYEDLVDAPEKTVSDLMSQLNIPYEPQQLRYWEHTQHNICGNRMRLSTSKGIKKDNEYVSQLSFVEWWLSTVYTHKLLRTFSYPYLRV